MDTEQTIGLLIVVADIFVFGGCCYSTVKWYEWYQELKRSEDSHRLILFKSLKVRKPQLTFYMLIIFSVAILLNVIVLIVVISNPDEINPEIFILFNDFVHFICTFSFLTRVWILYFQIQHSHQSVNLLWKSQMTADVSASPAISAVNPPKNNKTKTKTNTKANAKTNTKTNTKESKNTLHPPPRVAAVPHKIRSATISKAISQNFFIKYHDTWGHIRYVAWVTGIFVLFLFIIDLIPVFISNNAINDANWIVTYFIRVIFLIIVILVIVFILYLVSQIVNINDHYLIGKELKYILFVTSVPWIIGRIIAECLFYFVESNNNSNVSNFIAILIWVICLTIGCSLAIFTVTYYIKNNLIRYSTKMTSYNNGSSKTHLYSSRTNLHSQTSNSQFSHGSHPPHPLPLRSQSSLTQHGVDSPRTRKPSKQRKNSNSTSGGGLKTKLGLKIRHIPTVSTSKNCAPNESEISNGNETENETPMHGGNDGNSDDKNSHGNNKDNRFTNAAARHSIQSITSVTAPTETTSTINLTNGSGADDDDEIEYLSLYQVE